MSSKKLFRTLLFLFIVMMSLNSCTPEEQEFDRNLIIGKWASGTLFYRYDADGTGVTWDTSDDVNEDEAQRYTWTLVKSQLTQIHIIEMGASEPKVYEVTLLTETDLSYKDDFGKVHNFKKQ